MYITFIIVSVSKSYSIATANIRIAAAGQLHDTRVDQRKLLRYRVEGWSTQSAAVPRPMPMPWRGVELVGNVTTVSPRTRSARRE